MNTYFIFYIIILNKQSFDNKLMNYLINNMLAKIWRLDALIFIIIIIFIIAIIPFVSSSETEFNIHLFKSSLEKFARTNINLIKPFFNFSIPNLQISKYIEFKYSFVISKLMYKLSDCEFTFDSETDSSFIPNINFIETHAIELTFKHLNFSIYWAKESTDTQINLKLKLNLYISNFN